MKNLMLACILTLTLGAHATTEIRVVNEFNQPIANAEILVGHALNDPFPNNLYKTGPDGVLEISTHWKTALPVTITAPDYLRTTFIQVAPAANTFQLHRKDSRTLLEISGKTTHFQGIKRDGKVDAGVTFPALSRRRLLQFDIATMISPAADTIRLLTEDVSIPSNVTLPEQQETYVLPITVNKPNYRMFVKEPGDYRMIAAHGQFPLKQVMNDLQDGKSFFEILQYLRFIGGGQRDLQVSGTLTGQDIAVNQIPFNTKVSVTGPALAGTDVMVSIPMTENNGTLMPSDMKRIMSGQTVQLVTPTASPQNTYIASLMMPASEAPIVNQPIDQTIAQEINNTLTRLLNPTDLAPSAGGLSLALQLAQPGLVPQFMSLVTRPQVQSERIAFGTPVANPQIRPVATYLILAEIEKPPRGQNGAEKRYRLWEAFAQGWVDGIDLPKDLPTLEAGKSYRWEVLFLGADADNTTSFNRYFLDEVTYISRNSLDI